MGIATAVATAVGIAKAVALCSTSAFPVLCKQCKAVRGCAKEGRRGLHMEANVHMRHLAATSHQNVSSDNVSPTYLSRA